MIMEIYSVKDKQVDAFLQPFFSPTVGSALRSISQVFADPEHAFSKSVSDFTLHRLGSFDDATGSITRTDPELICPLVQLVPRSN